MIDMIVRSDDVVAEWVVRTVEERQLTRYTHPAKS